MPSARTLSATTSDSASDFFAPPGTLKRERARLQRRLRQFSRLAQLTGPSGLSTAQFSQAVGEARTAFSRQFPDLKL